MKLLRLLIVMLAISAPAFAAKKAASPAAEVMQRCAAKVNASPSLSAKFTLTAGGGSYPCDMTVAKQRYCLVTPQMKVWYDGTTQWTYAVETKQLSISEPTAEELMESNPFAILNHWQQTYKSRRLKGSPGMAEVELTPKSPATSPVRTATVAIDEKTWLPSKIVVTLANGRTLSATIASISVGKALPQSVFTFDKSKHTVAETIDLR